MSARVPLTLAGDALPQLWDSEADDLLVCRAIQDETHDVRTFVFAASPPRRFHYRPGQFLTFAFEIDGQTVHRCYTLASTPTRPDRVSITVKRVPGGPVSNWLHDHLKVGDTVRALGPMGDFSWADHPADKCLFLSAGSGVTPLMSMARAHHDLASDTDILFVHSARSPADIVFREEVALMARARDGFRAVTLCETSGPAWDGFGGRLDLARLEIIAPDFREREIFVCGPAGYMAGVAAMLVGAGFDMARHHSESFDFAALSPAEIEEVVAAEVSEVPSHKVSFTKSRRDIDCAEDVFVLSAACAAGMRLPSSCTKGLCGTCKSRLVSGTVEMTHAGGIRQREIDQGLILICCSRPTSDLVIER